LKTFRLSNLSLIFFSSPPVPPFLVVIPESSDIAYAGNTKGLFSNIEGVPDIENIETSSLEFPNAKISSSKQISNYNFKIQKVSCFEI
jgi:hypothetical protein